MKSDGKTRNPCVLALKDVEEEALIVDQLFSASKLCWIGSAL